jgi:hypothetical protein
MEFNTILLGTIDNIVKATGLRRELVYGALGWLERENRISRGYAEQNEKQEGSSLCGNIN